MVSAAQRVIHADESGTEEGERVWRMVLNVGGPIRVAVTWKLIDDNLIETHELLDLLRQYEDEIALAQTLVDRAQEIVDEPMPMRVARSLCCSIVRWYDDHRCSLEAYRRLAAA